MTDEPHMCVVDSGVSETVGGREKMTWMMTVSMTKSATWFISTYTHTHIHTYTLTHIHTYTHTHIHTYTHTHIHTYTHTHRKAGG